MNNVYYESTKLNQTDINQTDINQTDINQTDINQTDINQTDINQTDINKTKVNQTDINKTKVNQTEINKTKVNQTEINKTKVNQTDINQTDINKTKVNQTDIDENWTHIVALVDCSGSMAIVNPQNTANELTTLVREQSSTRITASLASFSDSYQMLKNKVEGKEFMVTASEIYPTGPTAIQESFCKLIDDTESELAAMTNTRPAKVIMIILTDGMENASTGIYAGASGLQLLQQKIKHKREVYNWIFYLLAANLDAVELGKTYGIESSCCITYKHSQYGCSNVMRSTSHALSRVIGTPSIELAAHRDAVLINTGYTNNERSFSLQQCCGNTDDTH